MREAGPSRVPALLSVVVPLYNECGSLAALHRRLGAVLDRLPVADSEIVFIDDGSRDATFAELAALRAGDRRLRAIRFARNFGKEAAMAAGLRAARGDVVVLMDGDLQHPPELIADMLACWRAGAQMVTAVRRSRATDPWLRRQLSRAFYRLFERVSEVSLAEGGGDFRLFDRVVVDAPPMSVADTVVLSRLCDGVLVVVRAGQTPKPAVGRALEGVDRSKVLGLVLNEVDRAGDLYHYSYDYGYPRPQPQAVGE